MTESNKGLAKYELSCKPQMQLYVVVQHGCLHKNRHGKLTACRKSGSTMFAKKGPGPFANACETAKMVSHCHQTLKRLWPSKPELHRDHAVE